MSRPARLAGPVRPHLHAAPAGQLRAPGARAVAGVVVEGPAAVGVPAGLQPGPRAGHHGVVDRGQQARQGAVDALGHRAPAPARARSGRRAGGLRPGRRAGGGPRPHGSPPDAALVVGDGQLPDRGPQQHGPGAVALGDPRPAVALPLHPGRERRRRLEVVGAGLRVGRVDEAPHPLQGLGRAATGRPAAVGHEATTMVGRPIGGPAGVVGLAHALPAKRIHR